MVEKSALWIKFPRSQEEFAFVVDTACRYMMLLLALHGTAMGFDSKSIMFVFVFWWGLADVAGWLSARGCPLGLG